jgi:hypothetical protein
LSHELAQESYGSRSSLLSWSVPYSSEIEIIEFFFDDLQLVFVRLFWFSRGSWCYWSFDVFLRLLGDLLGFFLDLAFRSRDFFWFLDQRVIFLFWSLGFFLF